MYSVHSACVYISFVNSLLVRSYSSSRLCSFWSCLLHFSLLFSALAPPSALFSVFVLFFFTCLCISSFCFFLSFIRWFLSNHTLPPDVFFVPVFSSVPHHLPWPVIPLFSVIQVLFPSRWALTWAHERLLFSCLIALKQEWWASWAFHKCSLLFPL